MHEHFLFHPYSRADNSVREQNSLTFDGGQVTVAGGNNDGSDNDSGDDDDVADDAEDDEND